MLKKAIKNNKGGGDMSFSVVIFLAIMITIFSLLIDFWYASAAKSMLIKETEGAELYRLVTSLKNGTEDKNIMTDPEHADMTAFQNDALYGYPNELNSRLKTIPYLKGYDIQSYQGLPTPIGEMGIKTTMTYQIKAIVRSPDQIIQSFRNKNFKTTSAKDIKLVVQTKMVPYIFDNSKNIGH